MRYRTFSLTIGALLALIGVCAMAALLIATLRLRNAASTIDDAVQSVYAAEELRTTLLSDSRDHLLESLETGRVSFSSEPERTRWRSEIERHITTAAEAELVERTIRQVNHYYAERARLVDAADISTESYLRLGPALDTALASLDSLIELNRSQVQDMRHLALVESRWFDISGFTLIAMLLILIGIIPFLQLRFVFAPVRELGRAIENFRRGETGPTPGQNTVISEFQEIGKAFDEMARSVAQAKESQLRFIASIAHDIRNPLHAVRSALSLIRRDSISEEKRREFVDMATRQIEHLAAMTRDLSDRATIESGHLVLRRKHADLAQLVRDSAALFESSERHTLNIDVPDSCIADCDPERINRVISNLLSNAIKYSPRGGDITVRLDVRGDTAELSVRDQGIGIAPDDQQRIFEPFRRTEATSRAYEGLGLGLSVVRRIVDAHGGRIELDSALGIGTEFRVFLPGVISVDRSSNASGEPVH